MHISNLQQNDWAYLDLAQSIPGPNLFLKNKSNVSKEKVAKMIKTHQQAQCLMEKSNY